MLRYPNIFAKASPNFIYDLLVYYTIDDEARKNYANKSVQLKEKEISV